MRAASSDLESNCVSFLRLRAPFHASSLPGIEFAARGASVPGHPAFHAELADLYREPAQNFLGPVDICLRHVAAALLVEGGILASGESAVCDAARADLCGQSGSSELLPGWGEYVDDDGTTYFWNDETGEVSYAAPTQQLDTCTGLGFRETWTTRPPYSCARI